MSHVWPVNILFHTWDRCLFILVDSRLKISREKKSRQIQAESSDFILNPDLVETGTRHSPKPFPQKVFWDHEIVLIRTRTPPRAVM